MKWRIASACISLALIFAPTLAVASLPPIVTREDVRRLKAEANAGSIEAMVELAEDFHFGYFEDGSVPERAIYWYNRAVDAGSIDAQFGLCRLYAYDGFESGAGADNVRAEIWCKRAAKAGQVEAQNWLGWHYEEAAHRDYALAREWWLKAARQGDEFAGERLRVIYRYGADVSSFDEVWDRAEAEAVTGSADAQWRLGEMFQEEVLGRYDEEQARGFLTASADQGNADGLYALALMYMRNVDYGDTELQEKVLCLLRRAADQGHFTARAYWAVWENISDQALNDPDERMIFEWWQDGAERGYYLAQVRLAQHYLEGKFVEADPVEAWKWCLISRDLPANAKKDCFMRTPSKEVVAEAQRRADEWIAAHPVPEWMPAQ